MSNLQRLCFTGALGFISFLGMSCGSGNRSPEFTYIAKDSNGVPVIISRIKYKEGDKFDVLVKKYGVPTSIAPASEFGARWSSGKPTVVLSYDALRSNIWVERDGTIVGVLPYKEFR